MAKFKYRISSRGRSRTLDIEQAKTDIIFRSADAQQRLSQIRKATKGFRDESVLGSYTSAPDFVYEALDLLDATESGRTLKPQEAEFIRETLKTLKELSSPQERVYSRALAGEIMKEYSSSLEELFGDSSKFAKEQIKEIKETLQGLTPQKQQEFFTSKYYQDIVPKKKYKHIKEWAESDSGRTMTYQESWAYSFKRRLEDFMAG